MRIAVRLSALAAVIAVAVSGSASARQPPETQTQTQSNVATAPPAPPPAAPPFPGAWTGPEYVTGSPKAKVTVVEYASASCPHCARFDAQVFPAFKAKYVDTGKVRYVFREFLTPPEDIAAIGFLMARCAGHDRYFHVVEQVFAAQPEIYKTSDVKAVFVRIAKENGLSEAQLDACVADKAAIDALDARVQHAVDVDKVNSTPTILINGQPMARSSTKELDFAQLDADLQPLTAHR